MLDWLWTGQSGVIVILSSQIKGLLHTGFVTDDGMYHDMIDRDQSRRKINLVSKDVRKSVHFSSRIRTKSVQDWYDTRKRQIHWVKYHKGTKLSAVCCLVCLAWVTATRWKSWSDGTWKQYWIVVVGAIRTFLK